MESPKFLLESSLEIQKKKEQIINPTGDPEQDNILSGYTTEQQIKIQDIQRQLSALAYFIGKDFEMPILLNTPGGGWFWSQDGQRNIIKIDPDDLLNKPIEYLRHVISHEGGHRRISKIEGVVPQNVWARPGVSFLFNVIEDGRNDNFVTEAYPRYKEQTELFFKTQQQIEEQGKKVKKKIGYQPKFYMAGHELLKQWFREYTDEEFAIDPTLPEDVQEVVKKTLPAAQEYWWKYPSKEEANDEKTVTEYAKAAYEIAYKKIIPEFQELIEEDIKFQKIMEVLKSLADRDIPDDLKEELEEDEYSELTSLLSDIGAAKNLFVKQFNEDIYTGESGLNENEIEKELETGLSDTENFELSEKTKVISASLKEKLLIYLDKKEELKKKIQEILRDLFKKIENLINGQLEGKFNLENNEDESVEQVQDLKNTPPNEESSNEQEQEDFNKKIRDLLEGGSLYEKTRQELLPLIETLERDLREIFTERRSHSWQGGLKQGKRLNVEKRIQEKAKGVSAFETKSWERRMSPEEKDYEFSLLVDLSGSMARGGKVMEAFKSIIVLAEVLNRLSINFEITGFNAILHPYQKFGEVFDDNKRKLIETMISQVRSKQYAIGNDDGWAIKNASKNLAKQKGSEKFLLVLSDGLPAPVQHFGPEYDVKKIVDEITRTTDQKVIGFGIGGGTEHVSKLYPSNIPNITVSKLSKTLAGFIKKIIAGE